MQTINYSWAIVFGTGMLGIWKAVPVGFALGTNPVAIWFLTVLGATASAVIIFFFGNKIRNWIQQKRKSPSEKKHRRVRQLFDKYGTGGLGLLGTLLIGPNATMLLGLIVVQSPRKLLLFTLIGVALWTLLLTLLGVFSIDLFHRIAGTEPPQH